MITYKSETEKLFLPAREIEQARRRGMMAMAIATANLQGDKIYRKIKGLHSVDAERQRKLEQVRTHAPLKDRTAWEAK